MLLRIFHASNIVCLITDVNMENYVFNNALIAELFKAQTILRYSGRERNKIL